MAAAYFACDAAEKRSGRSSERIPLLMPDAAEQAAIFAVIYKIFLIAGPGFVHTMPALFRPLFIMVEFSILINISLAVFNMVPVPPLDGSKVITYLLPPEKAFAYSRIEPYGFMILLLLIITGALHKFVSPIVFLMANILTGGQY